MTSQSTATLRTRYIEQAASDLETNRHQQEELSGALQRLKQEEALLVDILSLAERYEGLPDSSDLPVQKRAEPTRTRSEQPAPLTSEVPPRRLAHARGGRSRKAVAETGAKGKSRQPMLGEILTELLGSHEEPRLAKELRDELMSKHPDRSPTPQVVRNTLESLVAKGRVQRHKQQRSVMYTLAGAAENVTSPDDAGGADS
ncbi:hypothetical protein AB0O67_05220 [Streptomyces sp. NPDC086077]|uniref:hypothetical protein n=1 Tax=Streptomyces sp. NPDC086077 TaxID=3154862 RepID=UPI0034262FC7